MAFDIIQYNRDQFKNNIDWLAKSMQNFVDFIFGKDVDNSQQPANYADDGSFHCFSALYLGSVSDGVYAQSVYSINQFYGDPFNGSMVYDHLQDRNNYFNHETWYNNAFPLYQDAVSNFNWVYDKNSLGDNSVYYSNWAGNRVIRQFSRPDSIDSIMTYGGQNSFRITFNYSGDNPETSDYISTAAYNVGNNGDISVPWFMSMPTYYIGDIDGATNIYNETNHYNEYHTTNNITIGGGASNGGGDIFVGGGLGGIAIGVAGLVNYNDIELALDGLLDDININLGDEYKLPVTDFPTYSDIKYSDMGSFYITPVKQIPALPDAPDVADTFVDVSDYVALLGGSVTKLTSIFGSIGLDMMLVLTFLSCLVIRHLRR